MCLDGVHTIRDNTIRDNSICEITIRDNTICEITMRDITIYDTGRCVWIIYSVYLTGAFRLHF